MERREAYVFRQVDAPGAIVAQHVSEQFRIAVKEILVRVSIVEELLLDGAEQRVRILLDGLKPRLETSAADVEAKSSISETTWPSVVYSRRHGTPRHWDPADR